MLARSWESYIRLSVRPSVRLSHACFVTNPKNLPAIFYTTRKGNPSSQMWFFVQLCSSWHDFNWLKASRGSSAIAELLVPILHEHLAHLLGWLCRNFTKTFGVRKLNSLGYRAALVSRWCLYSFWWNTNKQTGRRTNTGPLHIPR